MNLQFAFRRGREREAAQQAAATMPAADLAALQAFAAALLAEQELRQGAHSVLVLPAEQASRVLRELGLPESAR